MNGFGQCKSLDEAMFWFEGRGVLSTRNRPQTQLSSEKPKRENQSHKIHVWYIYLPGRSFVTQISASPCFEAKRAISTKTSVNH